MRANELLPIEAAQTFAHAPKLNSFGGKSCSFARRSERAACAAAAGGVGKIRLAFHVVIIPRWQKRISFASNARSGARSIRVGGGIVALDDIDYRHVGTSEERQRRQFVN